MWGSVFYAYLHSLNVLKGFELFNQLLSLHPLVHMENMSFQNHFTGSPSFTK